MSNEEPTAEQVYNYALYTGTSLYDLGILEPKVEDRETRLKRLVREGELEINEARILMNYYESENEE